MTSSDREGAAHGRPSLFADQDHLSNAHADPTGVRILSTLESQQRPPPRRRVGELSTRAPNAPTPSNTLASNEGRTARWTLWGLVSAGLLLACGGLWLSTESTAPQPHTETAAAPVITKTLPSQTVVAAAPLAAVIENAPPMAGPATPEPVAAATTTALSSVTPPSPPPPAADTTQPTGQAKQGKPTPSKPDKPASQPRKRNTDKAQAAATKDKSEAKARAKAKGKGKGKADDDVALLEAMFTHAGKRQAPSSATQQLAQQCGPLTGSEARSCQSRVCQQYPTASVCR